MIQAQDVQAFQAAWRKAKAITTVAPNATVQIALDRLAAGVRKRIVAGSTVGGALKRFQAAVGKGEFTSDPASLDATIFKDGDRLLVDVRMGFASSVVAFDPVGKRLAVPPLMRWSYQFAGPFRRIGTLIALDASSLQDAGVRYAYRLGFLRRTPAGYADAGIVTGVSNYDFDETGSPRLIVNGNRFTVKGLDSPRSFFTSNAESLLRRSETWTASVPTVRRIGVRLDDLDVRAADAWLATHAGTKLGKGFTVQKNNGMANEVQRGKGWLVLDLEGAKLRFDLAAVGGKNVVKKVTALR